ncbi:MAG: hypothetical protein ACP5R5_05735 [Armatimonadota bacterium]
MPISEKDRSVLRSLAERVAKIAALPIHKETAREWARLNGLKPGRPLVWINEIPWHEMNYNDELTLVCEDEFCRGVEWQLRTTIYQWEHMRADMVVEPVFYSALVIHDTGFGIQEQGKLIPQSEAGGICAHGYTPQIKDEQDIQKIKDPVVTHDSEASERNHQTLVDLFGDILPVVKRGIVHWWFAPWDLLIQWWGVEEALTDMAVRPELVHMAIDRLVNAYLSRLRQWEELNLLSFSEGNNRVGSGGLGYTDELPAPGFDPEHVRTMDQWGCATAQIFSTVSPPMHEEFALQYERRWLSRFGLNYYGCCEPLHDKLDILASVPNLRKVSMSPWADVDQAVPKVAGKYVFSHKPSPAVFAADVYNPEQARRNLVDVLDRTDGCVVEVIMKDISTVRGDPRRLWQWAEMAMDVVERYG